MVIDEARRRRLAGVEVDGSISSGGMFSPNVRDSLVAILRLRAISSSATPAVDTAETGELKLMADVADNGEWVAPGRMHGSRTINTGRKLWPAGFADGAAALEEEPRSPERSGVSPRSASTLRVDRMRRIRCA